MSFKFNNTLRSFTTTYNKSSSWCKVLIFVSLLLLLILGFKGIDNKGLLEGFDQNDQFLLKTGTAIYDDFYVTVYDYLVFNNVKDDYEVGQIMKLTTPTSKSRMLDIGCGTGHHVSSLASKGFDVLGIDNSPAMINKAIENFPDYKFEIGDGLQNNQFEPDSFTHILCMYFTIYYFKDKKQFFENCYKWLLPGGYLCVHIVDRKQFDPILPPGNPLLYVSPQRYAKERITSTKVKFTDFSYSADFQFNEQNDTAIFIEKFKNDSDGKVRKNELTMYMPDTQTIIDEAQACGFIVQSKIDLLQCQYEYQYIYMFVKPN